MMRSRTHLFFAFLFIWIVFTTYFLLTRPYSDVDNDLHKKIIYEKLGYLQDSINKESAMQEDLLANLVKLIRARQSLEDMLTSSTELYSFISKHGNKAELIDNYQKNDKKEQIIDNISNRHSKNNLSSILKVAKSNDVQGPIIPVLVFACNRPSVRKCLDNLIDYRPNVHQFPIIVSQDCDDEATRNTILSYKDVVLIQQPDQSDIHVSPKDKKFKGYYKIARHYGWALNTVFKEGFEYVIIVEDDLNVAPDFYEYFLGTHELLKNDSSLWCISAWNDNGKQMNIDESSPDLLYRTDFFPGLGWMLTKNVWSELSVKWPKAFWDDWIRHPEQRKNRACIRPEISRTRTFGKIGVSNGLFFEKHLKYIKLSEVHVNFTKKNLTYLLKDNYDELFLKQVYDCPVVTYEELRREMIKTKGPVRIQYNTKDQYKRTAKLLGLMDDFKSGVPRTGYHGIVSFFYNTHRVFLAPNKNWKGYDLSWS